MYIYICMYIYIYTSRVTHLKKSHDTHEQVMSHIRMSHGTHTGWNGLLPTPLPRSACWGMSRIAEMIESRMSHVTHMIELRHTYVWVMRMSGHWVCRTYERFVGMSHVTRMNYARLLYDPLIGVWVMSHKWMRHGNEAWQWAMAKSHGNQSCHT